MRQLLATLAIAFAAAPCGARAATMEVAPVVIDLGRAAPSALLAIRNSGTTPTRFQLSAMAWTEAKVGEPKLAPSQELSFFPPIFQLAPGAERKIRVGAVVAPGATERAWRLFVEELPESIDRSSAGATVKIRTRFALPVFLAPAQPRPSSQLGLGRSGSAVTVTVRNTGNVRVKPQALSVAFLGAAGERLHAVELPLVAVLAGGEHVLEATAPQEVCAKVRKATLAAEIEGERRSSEIALPDGACAP